MGRVRPLVVWGSVALLCWVFCVEARAQVYAGSTQNVPISTWTRPLPDGSSLSTVTVPYAVTGIRVSTNGNFSFTGETHGTFDNVEFLYNSSFNVATPLTGFLRGVNAVGFGGTESMTAIPLTSNTLYYVVTTGFNATDAGPYVLTFSGPSSVTQVFIPPLPGDYTRDGKVDASDYVVWRDTLGTSATFFSGADGNGSGAIDAGDYGVWRANFGRPSGGAAAGVSAVPEPGGSVLFLMCAVARFATRRG
jgi:hypothetical protein